MIAVQEGTQAPDFALEDASGRTVTLGDFAGKNVILYFYPADDTPGCTKEACSFRDLWGEIQKTSAVVVGVSPDDPTSHRAFVSKYTLPFPLLCDPSHQVMERYGAWGEKTLYGKKTIGVIRSTVWIGPDGVVKKHWKKVVDAAKHPAQVFEALQAARG
ncbi:MAG: peroxiredoxin [Planctomycetes bacterium]|nr:peroxiredoxin [Planctomycetota bacterium]